MPFPFALPAVKALLPKLIGPALIAILILSAIGYHKFTVWRVEQRVEAAELGKAKAEKEQADAEKDTAKEHARLVQSESNVATLQATVRRQNDAITALHEVGRHYEVAAKARAVERLRTGEKERLVIRLDPNFGPESMNLWFRLTFPGAAK